MAKSPDASADAQAVATIMVANSRRHAGVLFLDQMRLASVERLFK